MRTRWWMAVAALAPLFVSAGKTRADGAPITVADGKHVYEQRCATCHGLAGDGKGPTAKQLSGPRPRDFTPGIYEFRTTDAGRLPRRADLVRTIDEGVPTSTMPSFRGVIPPADMWAVAEYVEGFSPRFAKHPDSTRVAIHIPAEPPPPTAQELNDGKMFYYAFRCWECHGVTGAADGPANPLLDDWKMPIKPANLTTGKYKSGSKATDLYRTIATGLDGTGMPTFRLAVMVGKDGLSDLGKYADRLDPGLHKQVSDFVSTLMSDEKLFSLCDADKEKLTEKRLWLLVRYTQSLAKPSVLDFVFDNPAEP